ncbi:MAG: SUMF1/EgtB/PvdO family nonheme iron enzyme [Phycisphaerales bacterium]|nr:SUMF1/EgtB/PvdO family nonheme iron enzyme [Phycisphaerales bacterium]
MVSQTLYASTLPAAALALALASPLAAQLRTTHLFGQPALGSSCFVEHRIQGNPAGHIVGFLWSGPYTNVVALPGTGINGLLRVDPLSFVMLGLQISNGVQPPIMDLNVPGSASVLGGNVICQSFDIGPSFEIELSGNKVSLTVQSGPSAQVLNSMVPIGRGTFQMGSTAPVMAPPHFVQGSEVAGGLVTITQPFWIGRYEVTQGEFQAVMGYNPSIFTGAAYPTWQPRPVENVTWNEAVTYCQNLTAMERAAGRVPHGYEYRLPTEAEWEYCCRAGTTTEFHAGQTLTCTEAVYFADQATNSYCWSYDPKFGGTGVPNAWGLYDMHGNVAEWCVDTSDVQTNALVNYPSNNREDPVTLGGAYRVHRGGSYQSFLDRCRSTSRAAEAQTNGRLYLGFRVVLAPALVMPGMSVIAPGSFNIGSPEPVGVPPHFNQAVSTPVTNVTITRPFWMGEREVTQAEYVALMNSNPSFHKGPAYPNSGSLPVENVTWYDAMAYCAALTAREDALGRVPSGYMYRLPTEAEWEYCCRAGTATEFSFAPNLACSDAVFWMTATTAGCNITQPAPAGSFAPNTFGLYDMHGNVAEWCYDSWDGTTDYFMLPSFNPFRFSGNLRIVRGGSWGDSVEVCRSAYRSGDYPTFQSSNIGFRVVLAPAPGNISTTLGMVPITPGTYQRGSNYGNSEEMPVHQVTLTAHFWMGKHEVTQAQYQAVMGSNPSFFQGSSYPNAPQRPVEQVSWNNARAYCQALTTAEQAAGRVPPGYEYRLPTDAEWEYCCRAGTTTEWHTGTSLTTTQANCDNTLGQTAVVGSYAPNAFGLHDMHGNVYEWCLDNMIYYTPAPETDPFVTGTYLPIRVVRSGNWSNQSIFSRSASRWGAIPATANSGLGFRVVLAPALVP